MMFFPFMLALLVALVAATHHHHNYGPTHRENNAAYIHITPRSDGPKRTIGRVSIKIINIERTQDWVLLWEPRIKLAIKKLYNWKWIQEVTMGVNVMQFENARRIATFNAQSFYAETLDKDNAIQLAPKNMAVGDNARA
eukprot:Platyproteum_vivax@DN7018_c0_g1_i1.p1